MPLYPPLPVSGQFLCTPAAFSPATQAVLGVVSTAMGVPGLQTTVASGSNGGEISLVASWASPSGGVLDVASTTGFPSTGTLNVQASSNTVAVVTYTGTSGGNSFTGCAYVSGSATGTVATGGGVILSGAGAQISTGPFAAPPSGDVMVNVFGLFAAQSSNNAFGSFGLCADGTTTPMVGTSIEQKFPNSAVYQSLQLAFLVTGLTAGTSYNLDLMACCSNATILSLACIGQTSTSPTLGNGQIGAAPVMTVRAV